MSLLPKYKNKQKVDAACAAIMQVAKPGDVINQRNFEHHWWEIWLPLVVTAIRWYQRDLFGKQSNWKDTHTMLFFDQDHTFSVELPKATFKPLSHYCLSDLSIYRLKLIELNQEHITEMREVAEDLKGEDYDIGQLLDIAINSIMGYKFRMKYKWFDFGKKKKVCSVGVRVPFEKLYQNKIRTKSPEQQKWLFYQLNPDKWPQKKVQEYTGTDIEMTTPAHFANSDYFLYEFELVAKFKDGRQTYPST